MVIHEVNQTDSQCLKPRKSEVGAVTADRYAGESNCKTYPFLTIFSYRLSLVHAST